MKKYLFSALVAALLVAPLVAGASTFTFGEEYLLPKGEAVIGNLYLGNGDASIGGTVTGDLVVAGGSVSLSGNVSRDLIAAGGELNLLGPVAEDVRVAGGNVIVEDSVGGDLIVLAGTVKVLPGSVIVGDIRIMGGNVVFEGTTYRSLEIIGGRAVVNGTVSGNVKARATEVVIGENANIAGNLAYASKEKVSIHESARIAGEVTRLKVASSTIAVTKDVSGALFGFFSLFKLFVLLASGLVLFFVAPRPSDRIARYGVERFWSSTAKGFIGFVTIPVLGILLIVSLLGALLGGLLFLGYIILLFVAKIYAGMLAGLAFNHYALRKDKELDWQSVFIGIVLLHIVGLVPYVGWVVSLIAFFASLGSLLHLKYSYFRANR